MKKKHESGGLDLFNPSVLKLLVVMKMMIVLICCVGLLSSFGKSYSQNTKLSVEFKNSSIENVLNYIESRTEYSFMYDNQKIDISREVNISAKNQTVESILDLLFENGVNYQMIGKHIIITPKESQFSNSTQQSITVSGHVSDDSDVALPGVSVVVKGTTNGTITNINGNYTLTNVPANATLQFSFVGMKAMEIAVGGKTSINATLTEESVGIEEVIAVGYSSTQRKNIASSFSVVNDKDITNLATTDIRQTLQGKVSGVQVINNNGDPGSSAKIIIRGIGSFSSTEPLYVINGISGGDINSVSPQDIQSITVLKDAASTAIYGAAAANGVVIITTKRGSKGAVEISYDGSYGISMVGKKIDLLNATQYVDLVNDIQTNNGLTLTDYLETADARVDRTDWQDEVFRTAQVMNYNLRLSGGGESATYAVSAGYLDEESILIDSRFKRFNFGTQLSEDLLKGRIKLEQGVRLKYDVTNGQTASLFDVFTMPPYLPIYNSSVLGGYARADKIKDLNDANNPYASVYLSPKNSRSLGAELDLSGEVKVIDGLSFKTQARLNASSSHNATFNYPLEGGNFTRSTASMNESYSYSYGINLENFFNYNKSFNIHNISFIAGNSYQPSGYSGQLSVAGANFSSTAIHNIGLVDSANRTITGVAVNGRKSRLSYFGRLGYTLDDKYILNATMRRDASSVFGANNKWGTFYGLGAAWVISEEDFMKSVSVIDNLKLRVSYGKTGNDNIPMFLTSSTVWTGDSKNIVYSFGDNDGTYVTGATINSIPNPDLKWEETKQTDIGFDLSLLKKVNIVFDYYERNNTDLLIQTLLPTSTGLGNPGSTPSQWVNAAGMKNTGFELSVTFNDHIKDFKWDVTANATYGKNEVTALGTVGETPILTGNTRTDIGHPLSSYYGYKVNHIAIDQADIDQLNAIAKEKGFTEYQSGLMPGDRIWQDVNGDGHIDTKDRTYIGNPAPKWQYGLTLNGEYKNFDFQVMLQGLVGVDVVYGNRSLLEGMVRPFNASTAVLDRWKKPGDIAPLPVAGRNAGNNTVFSDWFVEKGDYMRVKNISVGYTLPSNILKTVKLRAYLALQNVLTISNYSGYDPEIGGIDSSDHALIFERGIDNYQHPNPRIYRLGLQLNF